MPNFVHNVHIRTTKNSLLSTESGQMWRKWAFSHCICIVLLSFWRVNTIHNVDQNFRCIDFFLLH